MNLGFGTSTYSIKSPGFIKYLKEDGKAKTLVRTGGASKFFKKAGERSLTELKKYWIYYSKEGTVFAALNSTAFNTILVGSSIQSMDSDAKQLIEDICFNIDLEGALLEATLHSLIFGDSYLEKRRTADGNIVKLHPVDPQTMVINYNEFGDIVSYQQKISGRLIEPVIKPEDIIHIRFLPIPGSPYGVSLIEPNVDIIERKLSIEEAIYNAMIRHGTGKWVIYVGSEKDGQTPPDDVMDKIAEKFENINEINEVVLPWFIKLEAVDEQGIEGVDTYYDYFQTQLVVGLMCPEEALGQGKGSTEATARVKSIMYERMIKAYQQRISQIVRTELFNETLLKHGFVNKETKLPIKVELVFNSVTEEDEALRAKWLGNLLRGFPDGDMPFTRNEIRAFFNLPQREDMENIPESSNEEDKEPKEERPKPKPKEELVEEEDEEDEENE